MTEIKKIRGITLISLVITIIILLILAGVTIAQLTESGLFEKAILAKKQTRYREAYEILSLKINEFFLQNEGNQNLQELEKYMSDDKELNLIVVGYNKIAMKLNGITCPDVELDNILVKKNKHSISGVDL